MKLIVPFLLLSLLTTPFAVGEEIGKVEVASLTSDFHGLEKKSPLRFSWKLKVEGRAQLQAGYRILLAKTEAALKPEGELVWDSGEVDSFQSVYIDYDGPELKAGERYFWKVQLRNNEKKAGQWSAPASLTIPKEKAESKDATEDVSPIGSFECSDATLTSLFQKTLASQKTVLTSPATFEPDGLPWGAPLQLTARGYAFQSNLSPYFRSWSEELLASIGEDKRIPSLAGKAEDNEPAPGFSEAGVVIPFALWQLTGDLSLAEPSFLPAVEHVQAMQKNDPEYAGKPFGKHRGDWGHKDDATSAEFLSLCHLALSCRILGETATAVGHLPYIVQHKEWFSRIQKAFPENFLNEEGQLKEKSQTAQILALRYGLLPQDRKQPLADALAERIEKEGLTAGMLGQAAILPVLSWTNHHEQAIELAKGYGTEEATPSPVELATTSEWMMSFLAGFIHQAPGFKTSRISPFIPSDGSVTEVKAHHETPYGRLAIHWKTTENGLTAKVTIPPNTTGIISLPGDEKASITESGKELEGAIGCQLMQELNGRKEIIAQSGTYQFEIKNAKSE